MTIDFHTHAFPEKLARRAIDSLSQAAGFFPHTDGTVSGLRSLMRRDGVDISVLLPIATSPHSQRSVNDFALASAAGDIVPFCSVHPDAPDALDELDRMHALGVRGVKFHPEYQGFFADDEKMRPIYRRISALGMITLFHAGPDSGFRPPYRCMPDNLRGALRYLDAPVVAAHWGGLDTSEEILAKLRGIPQLYLDTAFGYGTNIRPFAQELIGAFGPDHILFGSDAPWHPPAWEKFLFSTLGLSPAEEDAIFSGNARRLLGI